MTYIQFPQINRKLTAGFWLLVFLLVAATNLWQNQLFKVDEEKRLRFAIMQNPNISRLHEKLAQYYLGVDEDKAKREYQLAQEYYSPFVAPPLTNVLGSESSPWQTWQSIEAKIQNLDSETKYWEKVSQSYPDYLYAKLKLAVLSLGAGETQKAKNYLMIILTQDPTSQDAAKLLEKLP